MPEMLKELAFTQEEIDELNRSREMPITFDEDCPETTPERGCEILSGQSSEQKRERGKHDAKKL